MGYEGSCHCGAVTFQVDHEAPEAAISCNCSHCRRKGLLLTFVPRSAFSVVADDAVLGDYRFNKHAIAHRFCRNCGCQPFASARGPDGAEMVAINLRCVPSLDPDELALQKVDGASF